MVTYSSGGVIGFTTKLVVGVFLCFGIAFLVIAATIVLSLISIYTPNHSEAGFGEQYKIKSIFIKALYQNISSPIDNRSIANNTALSTLCSSVYQRQGAKQFAGCLAQSFRAFGPHNVSKNSRRRRIPIVPNVGVYEIGEVNLYYSTSCPSKGDISKHANSTSLSACVKNRLTACNNLMNSLPNLTEWLPLPNPFSQSIVDDNGGNPDIIDVTNLFVIPSLIASSLATALNLSSDIEQNIVLGCQYIGPLPQANITNALLAQSIATTTQPTSSNSPYG